MQRRDFLKAAGAGAAALSTVSYQRVYGANDRLRVGLIGCGGRGTLDARLMRGTPEDLQAENYHDGGILDPRLREPRNVEIAALCDVNGGRLNAAKRWAPQAKTYGDFRQLLADKEIDAVIIATPDHWHAQMLILACEAGKDVYCEKPVFYRLGEGRAMIEAVRRNQRIVQVGTQHRSADHIAAAAKMVQSGRIGDVRFVRVWNFMGTAYGNFGELPQSPVPDSDPPADLNWDAWLGPAPEVPFNRNRLRYRYFMDYNNGIITDYGNHRFDSVHQIMGVDLPLTAVSSATRFQKGTAGDIYDLQTCIFEYPNFILNYEACNYNGHGLGGRTAGMRYYGATGPEDRPHGMAFYGTEAALFVDRIGMELYPEPKSPEPGAGRMKWEPRMEKIQVNEAEPTPLHTKNFVDFVRARKDPFANIEVGVRATTIGCIGNVAYWTGRKLKWDSEARNFPGDADANQFLLRPYRKPWDLVRVG